MIYCKNGSIDGFLGQVLDLNRTRSENLSTFNAKILPKSNKPSAGNKYNKPGKAILEKNSDKLQLLFVC